jgi:SAM-dependent methyltransferase
VTWHDVECGSYTADLPLWEELAAEAGGPVLEIGAGTGRVALDLARRGHDLIAVERDGELAGELRRRAAEADVPVHTLHGDARELSLEEPGAVALAIAPMHVLQALDEPGRSAVLASVAGCLRPGGLIALALVDEGDLAGQGGAGEMPLPEMRELDGWVFSSEPLWVQINERTITVRRIRQRVSPGGELSRSVHDDLLHRASPEEVEAAGAALGLRARERRAVPPGPGEAGSIVVILEAP